MDRVREIGLLSRVTFTVISTRSQRRAKDALLAQIVLSRLYGTFVDNTDTSLLRLMGYSYANPNDKIVPPNTNKIEHFHKSMTVLLLSEIHADSKQLWYTSCKVLPLHLDRWTSKLSNPQSGVQRISQQADD